MNKRTIYKTLLIVCMIILSTIILAACGSEQNKPVCTIKVADYISIKFSGYDEYGDAEINMDYEKMLTDIFVSTSVSDDIKTQYKSAVRSGKSMTIEADKTQMLSNGDVVCVNIQPNDEVMTQLHSLVNVSFDYAPCSLTAYGLADTIELDVLSEVNIDSNNSLSGSGTINAYVSFQLDDEEIVQWPVSHNGENGKLSNGDVITLKIADQIDIVEFTKRTGIKILHTESQHTIKELYEPIDGKEIIKYIDSTTNAMDIVIEDWVINCLNDEQTYHEPRTYKKYGHALYCNDDGESMIIGIYSITDPLVYDKYFVFVGLKGKFSANYYSLAMKDGQPIPDSFVYYEKEMVRYNAESGWGQNQESMGFLINDRAYAGHLNLSDTFLYLEETYGPDYAYLYVSESVAENAPERAEVVENVRKH